MKSERKGKIKKPKGKALIFAVLFATMAFASIGCAHGTTPPEDAWNPEVPLAGGGGGGGGGTTAPDEEWNKTFCGTGYDSARSVQQTSGEGYILAGSTSSYGAGDFDFWLVKTNSIGTKLWNKTFGGTYSDRANAVQQTTDDGYILAGKTSSYGAGSSDFWLVKTNSIGTELWNKTFGGTGWDSAYSVQQTEDGGYILAGDTHSYGAGDFDFWLVKTNSIGTKLWNKTFGGTGEDGAQSVQQTGDGGYILTGWTESYGTGSYDFWLVKTNSNGTEQWNKTFGGTGDDGSGSVQQTEDGGYIIAGWTYSYGAGLYDFWLVKTDSNGTEQWNKTFGGTDYDVANSVQQTEDGGYIIAGWTYSYGAGLYDFWLVKTDSNGTEQWNKTFGGTGFDEAYSVQQTADGGYILAGYTDSYGSDASADFWLIKVKGEPTEQPVHNIDTGKNFSIIQAAIDDAGTLDGHTIAVDAGTYYENVIVDKSLTLMGEDRDTTIIDGSGSGDVVELTSNNCIINGFSMTRSGSSPYNYGIKIISNNNILSNCNASFNSNGIIVGFCDGHINVNNTLMNNIANSNNLSGIRLELLSKKNVLSNNVASNNVYGIVLFNSSNNTLINNMASSNSLEGILLSASSNNNNLTSNTMYFNGQHGVYLCSLCNNNIIANNIINSNMVHGINLDNSSNNLIFHNNIVNNSDNAYDTNPASNDWHHPVLLEGNHWSDYTGVDDGSETGKHAIAGDGIGDTNIPHPSANYDNYPFMNESGWLVKPAPSIFDTDAGIYPSIMGTHTGTIIPSHNITVSTLYTYPCAGTGGHTESIELYNKTDTLIANGSWNGYIGDYHNITIHNRTGGAPYVTLLKGYKYNYTIITGSYPQIIHEPSKGVTGGTITCTNFTDANGVVHYDWIPAIRLYDLQN